MLNLWNPVHGARSVHRERCSEAGTMTRIVLNDLIEVVVEASLRLPNMFATHATS